MGRFVNESALEIAGRGTASDHKGAPVPTPPPSPLRTDDNASTNCARVSGARWVLDEVGSLIDKSLLYQTEQEGGEPRLGMLETLRE